MKRGAYILSLLLSLCCAQVSAADGPAETRVTTSSYIAPLSVGLYRFWQPDGVVRELDVSGPAELKGSFGWKGRIDGDRIMLRSGIDAAPEWQGTYVFEKGRLVSVAGKGGVRRFDWAGVAPFESIMALWPEASEDTRDFWNEMSPWRTSGRLKLWLHNPNRAGTLFAEMGILLIALMAFLRRRARGMLPSARAKGVRGLCILALAASVVLMFLSGSRGAFVAFAAAAAVWGLCAVPFVVRRGRHIAIGVTVGLSLVGLLLVCGTKAGVWGKRAKSDSLRLDIIRAVPQMMCDAPGGWGFVGAGKAYRDWYQRLDDRWVTFSLVSDHLTTLVNAGWPRRFAYLFGWLAVLGLLGLAARKSESARLALALGIVMGVSSAFNRIYLDAWSLWMAPLMALGWTCRQIPRKRPGRAVCHVLGASAALAGGILGLCVLLADGSGVDIRVRAEGERILVKGGNPSVWVVDDGWTLGGGLAGKELHAACVRTPTLPALGCVSSVAELPSSGVRRLVLAGKAGYEFLMALSEGLFPADFQVPPEIVFLSPPFPPSVVPELLLKNAKVRLIIGEFAALYGDEYRKPPPWVTVVPACELYIPDWIDRSLAQ